MAGPTRESRREPVRYATVDDLVAVMHEAGYERGSVGTIRYWQAEGLVTRPDGRGRQSRYPLSALAEVDVLARWGRRKFGADLLLFARYAEAGTGDIAQVRAACRRWVQLLRPGAAEAASLATSGADAIRREATRAARARGKNAVFPREIRMSLDERTQAHIFAFNALLGSVSEPMANAEGLHQFARLIGFHSGRGGKERDITPLLPAADEWQPDLDRLDAAATHASDQAFDLARVSVEAGFLWVPATLPLLWAEAAPSDAGVLQVMDAVFARLTPALYPMQLLHALAYPISEMSEQRIAEVRRERQLPVSFAEDLLSCRDPDRQLITVSRRLRPYQRVLLQNAFTQLQRAD